MLALVVDSFSLLIILAFISSPVAAKFPAKLELLKENTFKHGVNADLHVVNVKFYVVFP